MGLDWLFTWWNAVYTVPLAFVIISMAVTTFVGLVGGAVSELGHAGGHSDFGVGKGTHHDVDIEHDIDVHHEVDAHHDVDAHHEAGDGHHHDHHLVNDALVALGAGRAPVVLLLQLLLLQWGLVGILLHQAFGVNGPLGLLWSVPVSLVVSVLGTRTFALLFGRYFKPYESSAVRRNQLVGKSGSVVFAVSGDEGTVHVRDEYGTLHRVRARCENAKLEAGRQVIVLGYDPEQRVYHVDDSSAFVDRP
jgi:membrane protein implicated in regulation of membrane protease activity